MYGTGWEAWQQTILRHYGNIEAIFLVQRWRSDQLLHTETDTTNIMKAANSEQGLWNLLA
jgi:hypothetical protein